MVDLLNQNVEVGDDVLFPPPYSGKLLMLGKVLKLTPKGVTIQYKDGEKCNRSYGTIIKVTQQLQYAKETYPENFI